jgi:hypothetical protein
MNEQQFFEAKAINKKPIPSFAWILILIADIGLLLWGAMAALLPGHLLGPGQAPILQAGYEGFTGNSWATLETNAQATGNFINLLFRMYGAFNVAFALMGVFISVNAYRDGQRWAWWALFIGNTIAYVSAMAYDRIVGAIGIFEWSEYLGLAVIYLALVFSLPSRSKYQAKEQLAV